MTDTIETAPSLEGGLLIGGQWLHESSGGTLEHVYPATGKVQAEFPIAGPAEVDAAVRAAGDALADWKTWNPAEREAALRRLSGLLRERAAAFGRIGSLECGLPLSLAQYLAPAAAAWIDYYAGWIDKHTGETVPAFGALDYTRPEPIGVAAVILTWNSSAAAYGASVAAALAAGCTVVIKPAELAPFSGSMFGRACLDAGLPPGVVNVVTGGPATGDALVRHPGVSKISFTGGVETAKVIQASAAGSLTPLLLELGGKSANVVFADADVETVASVVVSGLAALNGQTCIAPTRLLIEQSVYTDVLEAVFEGVRALRLGDPFDPTTAMGPVICDRAVDRILGVIERANREGAGKLITGGHRLDQGSGGFFVAPTVFSEVDNASHLAQSEIFGPVLSALAFNDEEEAVSLANTTAYGLAAYVQTSDLERAHRVAHALDVGTVWVNALGNPLPGAPFGG